MLGVALGLLMLPLVPPDALPEALELVDAPPPYWRMQLSRSRPVKPTHWLGTDVELPAAAPASVLVLAPPEVVAPELGEVLGEVLGAVLGEALGAVLGEVLDPLLLPYEPDCCASDTPATPTSAAATATAIDLTITV